MAATWSLWICYTQGAAGKRNDRAAGGPWPCLGKRCATATQFGQGGIRAVTPPGHILVLPCLVLTLNGQM